MESQMKSLDLTFEFFDAIDGRQGLPNKYEKYVNRKNSLSDVEYGCALSHALLYKEIVDKKIPHSIILEEDCIIDNDFAKLVKGNYLQIQIVKVCCYTTCLPVRLNYLVNLYLVNIKYMKLQKHHLPRLAII